MSGPDTPPAYTTPSEWLRQCLLKLLSGFQENIASAVKELKTYKFRRSRKSGQPIVPEPGVKTGGPGTGAPEIKMTEEIQLVQTRPNHHESSLLELPAAAPIARTSSLPGVSPSSTGLHLDLSNKHAYGILGVLLLVIIAVIIRRFWPCGRKRDQEDVDSDIENGGRVGGPRSYGSTDAMRLECHLT